MTIHLSAREVEVLQMIALGLNQKEVADTLHISYNTVRTHCATITRKMRCQNISHCVATGIRQKIIV